MFTDLTFVDVNFTLDITKDKVLEADLFICSEKPSKILIADSISYPAKSCTSLVIHSGAPTEANTVVSPAAKTMK